MKKRIRLTLCALALLTLGGLSPVLAAPRGYSDTGMDYIEGSSDLRLWSIGFYSDGRIRDVEISDLPYRLETSKVMGYIGRDLTRWMVLYATAGSCKFEVQSSLATQESSSEYGVGLKINLLDHEIMDPTLLEDQIRLNATFQYSGSEFEWLGRTRKLTELSGHLTFGIVNDIEGNVLFRPNGIGVFAGGVYSTFVSGDIQERDTLGYTAGLEIYYTEKVTLDVRLEGFDDLTYLGGIHIRL